MTKNAFERIIDEIEKHRNDGYEVPAVRVPDDVWDGLLTDANLMRATGEQPDYFEEEWVGEVAGTGINVDENISDVVADDVELVD